IDTIEIELGWRLGLTWYQLLRMSGIRARIDRFSSRGDVDRSPKLFTCNDIKGINVIGHGADKDHPLMIPVVTHGDVRNIQRLRLNPFILLRVDLAEVKPTQQLELVDILGREACFTRIGAGTGIVIGAGRHRNLRLNSSSQAYYQDARQRTQ